MPAGKPAGYYYIVDFSVNHACACYFTPGVFIFEGILNLLMQKKRCSGERSNPGAR